jgi:single-stranded DNA-binding protein
MSTANITLVGRVTEVETRQTANTTITTLTIPTDSGWGDNKKVTWWKVKLFGKQAELASKIEKGGWVTVSGVPSIATWTGRDGTKQSTPEVEASSWSWVGPKPEDRGQRDDRSRDDRDQRDQPRGRERNTSDIPF